MTAIILNQQPQQLQERITEALQQARQLTQQGDRQMASVAWDEVEELMSKSAKQKAISKSNFEVYCQENPEAPEARIYDL